MKKLLILSICLLGAFIVKSDTCSNCYFPSSGDCISVATVCYAKNDDGTCPQGTSACASSGDKYACDSSSYTCSVSDSGTYDDQSSCDSACVAPATKYACDSSAYTCSASDSGTYDDQSSCDSACVAPSSKYACDSSSYTCSVNPTGTYDSQSACESVCVASSSKYACDSSSNTCSVSDSGTYDSQSACDTACQPVTSKWGCDGSTYTCAESDSGFYSSQSDCENACVAVSGDKVITNYFMINSIETLQKGIDQVNAAVKQNFNRITLSFIQPSIHTYVTGNLACTGILGHYCDNWNTEKAKLSHAQQTADGVADFDELKAAVKTFQDHNIEVFIAVGGWDYNCREDIYCDTLKYYNKSTAIVCDPPHYSYVCEPEGQNQDFDYFPDPASDSIATASYTNVVQLAVDLGCTGVDLDYEEFWHADYYRRDWDQEAFITAVREQSWKNTSGTDGQENMQYYYDQLSYDDMVSQFASASPNNDASASGPFVLPDTADKLYRIIQALENASAGRVSFSFAGPAVGAIPIMVPQYGDSNSLDKGGVWWGGNLKGLLYSLVAKNGASALLNWDIGIMSYDLGCKSGMDCGTGLPFGCTLQEQVTFYAGSYHQYMFNEAGVSQKEENLKTGGGNPLDVIPKYFNVQGKLQFGFEIGHPAYPAYDDSWKEMIALEPDVTGLLDSIGKDYDGIIVWEMFKPVDDTWTNEASVKYVFNTACEFYSLGSDYNCNSDYPQTSANNFENLFLQ